MRCLDFLVTVPPAMLPVSIDEFIDHARLNALTVDRQPELLTRQLTAATDRAQAYCRRSLITQTLRALFVADGLTCACTLLLALPRPAVQSVISVSSGGAAVDPTTYRLEWNTIVLNSALSQAATAEYTAGYGDDPTTVPAMIREGILEYAMVLYEARRGEREQKYAVDAGKTLPPGVVDLWRPYQVELGG